MATRGIIAVQRADGWRGRYAHWDNYPERIVPIIGRLAKRDGLAKVVTTLVNDNQSWSIIDDSPNREFYDEKNIIDGYGAVHDDLEPNDPSSWFTEEDTELAWAEWVYVIRDIGLEVMKVVNDGTQDKAVPYEFHLWEEIEHELVG